MPIAAKKVLVDIVGHKTSGLKARASNFRFGLFNVCLDFISHVKELALSTFRACAFLEFLALAGMPEFASLVVAKTFKPPIAGRPIIFARRGLASLPLG